MALTHYDADCTSSTATSSIPKTRFVKGLWGSAGGDTDPTSLYGHSIGSKALYDANSLVPVSNMPAPSLPELTDSSTLGNDSVLTRPCSSISTDTSSVSPLQQLRSAVHPYRPITKRCMQIIKNAQRGIFLPSKAQISFLAHCLVLNKDALSEWFHVSVTEYAQSTGTARPSREHIQLSSVAVWKHKLLLIGLEHEDSPSLEQLEFLAAGFQVAPSKLWKLVYSEPSELPSLFTDENCSMRDMGSQTLTTECSETIPGDLQGFEHAEPFWDMATCRLGVFFHEQVLTTSDTSCLDDLALLAWRDTYPASRRSHALPDTASYCVEQESEIGYKEQNIENEIALHYGHDAARLVVGLLNSRLIPSVQDIMQSAPSSRQRTTESTTNPSPASPSAGIEKSSTPMTNTTASGNLKRKQPCDDGLEEDDKPADAKRLPVDKPKATRWDCPFCRAPLGASQGNPGCARGGLEFRNLWRHLWMRHYHCERCGLKFDKVRKDTQHLHARQNDPSQCEENIGRDRSFEIGYDLYRRLADIYDGKGSHREKWALWWLNIFPNHGPSPDGIHQGTINFPSADLVQLSEVIRASWLDEVGIHGLPHLEPHQMESMLRLVDNAVRMWNFSRLSSCRMQSAEGQMTPHMAQYTGNTATPHPAYYPEDLDFNLPLLPFLPPP